jgi:hypothetical protein
LDPWTRAPFPVWCEKIEHVRQAGDTFNVEDPVDLYALLPSKWHDLHQSRSSRLSVLWNPVDLCKALYTEYSIPYKEQIILLVCYDLGRKNPNQLLIVDPPRRRVNRNEDSAAQMAAAAMTVEHAGSGISTFLLKPKDLNGEVLCKHMMQRHLHDSTHQSHAPITYLDVQCSDGQVQECGPDAKYLRGCSIMSDDHGAGTTMKLKPGSSTTLGMQSHTTGCRTTQSSGSVA